MTASSAVAVSSQLPLFEVASFKKYLPADSKNTHPIRLAANLRLQSSRANSALNSAAIAKQLS